MMEIIVTMHSD